MTFSIAARCPDSGMFGVAVASSSPAVAARCAYARANVGAALSQNVTDPRLGTQLLDAMASGKNAREAVADAAQSTAHRAYRQLIAVDKSGSAAVYSGAQALGNVGEAHVENAASGGNLLADKKIPQIMVEAFQNHPGHLADRLLQAMQSAVEAGGEAGPIHSAGMKLVAAVPWPVADLRVDWTEGCPVAELKALWTLYSPQLDDYVARALDPASAPSYGVPGDR